MAGLQWSCWNALLVLAVFQASLILPTGAWQALSETFWRGRCGERPHQSPQQQQ